MTGEHEASLAADQAKGEQEFRNLLSVLAKTNLVTEGGPAVSVRPVQARIEEARLATRKQDWDRALVWVAQASKDFGELVRQWEGLARGIEDQAKQGVSVVKWRRIQGFHNQRRPSIRHAETAFQRLRDALALLMEARDTPNSAAAAEARSATEAAADAAAESEGRNNAGPLPSGFLQALRRASCQPSPKTSRAKVVTEFFEVEAQLGVADEPGVECPLDELVPFPEGPRLYFLGKAARIVAMQRPRQGHVVQLYDPESGLEESMQISELKRHVQNGVWLLGAQ